MRRINLEDMGLLTDPNSGGGNASKLVSLVINYHRLLSWLLYVAGLVFLLGKKVITDTNDV